MPNETSYLENLEYTKKIAIDLHKLFKDVPIEFLEIINDCGDELTVCKAKKYKCVGSIFKEEVDAYNKHLEDNDWNRRHYNPESFKKYPCWDRF